MRFKLKIIKINVYTYADQYYNLYDVSSVESHYHCQKKTYKFTGMTSPMSIANIDIDTKHSSS